MQQFCHRSVKQGMCDVPTYGTCQRGACYTQTNEQPGSRRHLPRIRPRCRPLLSRGGLGTSFGGNLDLFILLRGFVGRVFLILVSFCFTSTRLASFVTLHYARALQTARQRSCMNPDKHTPVPLVTFRCKAILHAATSVPRPGRCKYVLWIGCTCCMLRELHRLTSFRTIPMRSQTGTRHWCHTLQHDLLATNSKGILRIPTTTFHRRFVPSAFSRWTVLLTTVLSARAWTCLPSWNHSYHCLFYGRMRTS